MEKENSNQKRSKNALTKQSYKKQAKKIKKKVDELDLPEREKLRAIALKYESGKGKAPKITATGKGVVAEKILELAEENKIPFYEDDSLTKLLSKLDFDTEIPEELFTLVAEVLAVVYQLDKMAKNNKNSKK